jgi:hypothetical protein
MINPPIKNPITAINEGSCKLLKPEIACPEVHPPAYRDPKPTRNPPMSKTARILGSLKLSVPKISVGKYASPALLIP